MSEPAVPDPGTPPAERQEWRRFFRDLFDLRFRELIAIRMLPLVYGIGISVSAIFTLYVVARAFKGQPWDGLLWLFVLGPAMFLTLVIALRIVLEFVLAFFRMAWYIESVAAHTDELRKDMPKFGWWRTLLFGEGGAPPGSKKPPDPG